MIQLRKWQERFVEHWDGHAEGQPYLLSVVPGGGKTIAALTVANQWIKAGRDRQLFIVVPTSHLRYQWQLAAAQAGVGLEMQTQKLKASLKDGYAGAVTTYQAACGLSHEIQKKLISDRDTMLILDEPHHCGDGADWGSAIAALGEQDSVKEVLLLSGTPWRSDGTCIPFVEYDEDGMAKPSFQYGYREALKDGVVRYINFDSDKGSADLLINNAPVTRRVASDVTVQEADSALRHMLDAHGDFMRRFLQDGRARLEALRARPGNHNAAGMVACIDVTEAKRVAKVLAQVTGDLPAIVTSDDPTSADTIKAFKESSSRWIVSVRQISEGTDIPRLQVLMYANNWLTEMFFQQLVGRVARIQGEHDREAIVMLPAHPTLLKFAKSIDEQQKIAIREKGVESTGEAPQPTTVVCVGTSHNGDDVSIIGGDPYPPEQAARIHAAAAAGNITAEQFLIAQKAYEQPQAVLQQAAEVKPKEEREKDLRSEIKRHLGAYAHRVHPGNTKEAKKQRGKVIAEKHAAWARHTGLYQEQLTEEQLKEKRDWAARLVATSTNGRAVLR